MEHGHKHIFCSGVAARQRIGLAKSNAEKRVPTQSQVSALSTVFLEERCALAVARGC